MTLTELIEELMEVGDSSFGAAADRQVMVEGNAERNPLNVTGAYWDRTAKKIFITAE